MRYGVTADTGGHIAYILAAAEAQALRDDVDRVIIATRLFVEPSLDPVHGRAIEPLGPKLTIERVATADRRYLEKEALARELPAFADAMVRHLAAMPRRPDVVHAHFADAAAVAIEIRRRLGIAFVYTPHALGIDKRRHQGGGPEIDARIAAERAAIEAADAVIVSTRDEAGRQVGAYGVGDPSRLHCVPPGVPRLAAAPAEAASGRPILLAIARPVRKKNLAALLRAYVATPALVDRADLVILAGQHEGRLSEEERAVLSELRALAADPRARGRATLPPRHDAGDVAALYARAARGGVFVNPAFHEPFGLTVVEAAAAGVPVVATRNGGPAEVVPAIGHGLLVDPADDAAIAAACLAILDDPARHAGMATAGRARVGLFDWNRYAETSAAIYRSIMAPRRPRLLACDVDGTLTGCGEGARAFAAWRAARSLPFVVATGRSFRAARAVLRTWGLPPPDAYIVDVGTRIVLPHAGGWRACRDYAAHLDTGWDRAAAVRALAPLGLSPQPPDTAGPHKLSFFGDRAGADRARDALRRAGIDAHVIFSHARLIDVLAPRGGKAAAIAFHAARLGLSLADCVGAGDSGNDLSMLEACGAGIVVANADGDLDGLSPRPGLIRTRRLHAAGVMEGLARLGLTSGDEAAAA